MHLATVLWWRYVSFLYSLVYTSYKLTDNSWIKHTRKYGFDFKTAIIYQMFHSHRIYIRITVHWEKRMSHRGETRNLSVSTEKRAFNTSINLLLFCVHLTADGSGITHSMFGLARGTCRREFNTLAFVSCTSTTEPQGWIYPGARGRNDKKAKVWRRRALFLTQLKLTDSPVP